MAAGTGGLFWTLASYDGLDIAKNMHCGGRQARVLVTFLPFTI